MDRGRGFADLFCGGIITFVKADNTCNHARGALEILLAARDVREADADGLEKCWLGCRA